MKQTDNLEREFMKVVMLELQKKKYEYKIPYFSTINKIEKIIKESHSQTETPIKDKENVGASEEEVSVPSTIDIDEKVIHESMASSVPYTPLMKQNRYGKTYGITKECSYPESKVLSALNGLKMDNCHNVIFRKFEKYCDVCEACKSINKWFPIINEVKKE